MFVGVSAMFVETSSVGELIAAKLALEHRCWKSLESEFFFMDCHSLLGILQQEDAWIS